MRLTLALLSSLLLVSACVDSPAPEAEAGHPASTATAPTTETEPTRQPTPTPTPAPPSTDVDRRDTRLAETFVAFGRGAGPAPRVGETVLFYLGGGPAGELSIDDADDREAWQICPPGEYYAAGTCPFDVLHVLTYAGANDIPLIYTHAPREDACTIEADRADLTAVQHLRRVVVSPPVGNCATDFRIELYYDGRRLAAFNLSLAEP